jgi:hypothetical protein
LYSTIVAGECTEDSHVAEGPAGADLTQRQSRFFCDSAVISLVRITDRRLMVQFVEKGREIQTSIIGFAGEITDDDVVVLDRVYLDGAPLTPSEGYCKFFYDDEHHLKDVVCGAMVDYGDRRVVPVVSFSASVDQPQV